MLILTLGAGTDYGLFLVFRVREELRAGRAPHDAVTRALARVGESITFSAATVIAALLTLLLATFGLVLQPRRPAGHRARVHAAGRPHPAAGAAGHRRPGRVLALPHGSRHRAHRLVGTHRGPRRRPSRRHARLRADRLRRAGHGRARLPAGRPAPPRPPPAARIPPRATRCSPPISPPPPAIRPRWCCGSARRPGIDPAPVATAQRRLAALPQFNGLAGPFDASLPAS